MKPPSGDRPPGRPPGRPSLQRVAEINDAIVTATIDAFAENGGDFSMDEVAAAAGISKQAIYRRWSSKSELLIHAISHEADRTLARATGALPDDPEAALREVAWRIFDTDKDRLNRIGIFFQAEALRNDQLKDAMLAAHGRRLATIETYIAPVVGDRETTMTTAELAELMSGLLFSATSIMAWTGLTSPEQKQHLFDQRWRVFTEMLAAR